jgi:hypothetical protein
VGTAAPTVRSSKARHFLRIRKTMRLCRSLDSRGRLSHTVITRSLQLIMARGWESKSVEQQQEEATSSTQQRGKPLSAEQIAENQKRKGLELSRRRILQQLEVASNPQHRNMLEAALAELNAQLKVTQQ